MLKALMEKTDSMHLSKFMEQHSKKKKVHFTVCKLKNI